jgi:uncharacterized protein involved in type VI secretion and phage assembly
MCDQGSNGIVVGIVTSLEDEDKIGRVKVRYPYLEDQESHYARIAAPMAGRDRGAFFCPETGDEVLVCFEQNDPRRPYVLGALWSLVDTPPKNDGDQVANNWRFFRSRSGHLLKLDDTKGGEKIELIDKDGKHTVAIDSAGDNVRVVCDTGDVRISASAGTVTISAKTVAIEATQDMKLTANGTMTISGASVKIN